MVASVRCSRRRIVGLVALWWWSLAVTTTTLRTTEGFLLALPYQSRRTVLRETKDSENAASAERADVYYSPNVPLRRNVDDEATTNGGFDVTVDDAAEIAAATVNEYSFFDEAIIYVRAGSGGQGSNTFKRMGAQQGPPDGGNGGGGGEVILEVDASLNTLAGLTTAWRPNAYGGSGAAANTARRIKSFRAENGADGERYNRFGRAGKGIVIRVPPGTVIEERIETDLDEGGNEVWMPLGSLNGKEGTLVVAVGGEGGEGTAVQGKNRGVRRPRLPSTGGERKTLKLTLKIVADVALVGVPNAGESSFHPGMR